MTPLPIQEQRTRDSLTLVLSATTAHVDQALERITPFVEEHLSQARHHRFDLDLVVREGLLNAVCHGNKNRAHTTVTCKVHCIPPASVHVEIQDQGQGFDWRHFHSQPASGTRENGRGILIMKTYCSGFTYNQKGNILYLHKEFKTKV